MKNPSIINNNNTINRKVLTDKAWSVIRAIILIEISFILLYPLIYTLTVAFRPPVELNDPVVVWIPKTFTFANIVNVWQFIDFPKLLGNTLVIDVVSAIFQTAACCFIGYGFARFKFKEKNILFAFVVIMIVLPPQTVTIANFIQFRSFGILDTPLAFYLPAITANGIRSGLFIFIYRQFFANMPRDLEDAAYIDGCNPFKTFMRIMLPNASSSVIIVFLFSIVWYWNDTFFSGMYLEQTQTISVALETLRSNLSVMIPGIQADQFTISAYMQAGVVLTIFPILIMYIVMQKYFTESIARTGLVG
jgi:multiple sugar transport system permease protein